MKKSMFGIILLVVPLIMFGQEPRSGDRGLHHLLQDQVDAYNGQDVERLVANVTEDFKWFSLSSDSLTVEVVGKKAFEVSMKQYFSSGRRPVSRIDSYSIDGNRISFREVVSHKSKNGETVTSTAMGIYEIRGEKISRAWYFVD